jgi:hypothetical protein
MRNSAPVVAHKPRTSLVSLTTAPSHFFKMHERAGASCVDALGKAGALTLFASGTGTPWANDSWITPDGANHYVQRTNDSMMQSIYRLDQPFGHILVGLDYYIAATPGVVEQLFAIGTDLGTSGHGGGWGLRLNTARQFQLRTRAISATQALDDTFTGYTTMPVNTRHCVLLEIVYNDESHIASNLYVDGALKSTVASTDLLANSGTLPYGSIQTANGSVQAYTIGALPSGTSTRSNLANAGGTSQTRYARWLGYRSSVRDAALAAKVALQMFQFQGEFPQALIGKTGGN